MYHQAAPPPPPPPRPITAKPPPSWRTIGIAGATGAALVGLLAVAAALSPDKSDTATATTTTAPVAASTTAATGAAATPVTYEPFDQVEPYTSRYFITLEKTGLAQEQGEERLYNLGLGVCRNLDGGNSIDTELAGLVDDARLSPGDAGALVGAAVTDMCPQHGPAVEQYLATH